MVDTAAGPVEAEQQRSPAPRPSRWRPFLPERRDGRHRRPADVMVLVLGGVLFVLVATRAGDVSNWEADFAELFTDAPSWLTTLLEWVLHLGSLWAVVVLAGGALVARRWRLARDLAVAGVLAWLVARGAALLTDPARRDELSEVFSADDLPSFPVVAVAVMTALVSTAVPYLVPALRRLSVVVPVVGAAAALTIPVGLPIDVLGALILGVVIGAAVHVAFGSPEGRPTLDQVVAAAAGTGVVVERPRLARHQPWGQVVVLGFGADGSRLHVKALGSDADDAKFLSRLWHRVWYRTAPEAAGDAIERVNREALVTLLAERAGVHVPSIQSVGGGRELAVLVEREADGQRLADLAPDEVTDVVLDRLWRNVDTLHRAGLAHGSLDLHHAALGADGRVQLLGFGSATTPASPAARHDDVAELLAATGVVVGAGRAVRAAHRVLEDAPLVAALPYIQPAALAPGLRERVKGHDKATRTKLLSAIQRAVLDATGAPAPEPLKLQRITWQGAAMVAATLFGVYVLLSQLTGLSGSLDELRDADWAIVGIALVIGQTPVFTDAIATLSAVNQPVAYGPTVVLQLAQKFTGLVVPSSLGTAAMNARYLNLQGVPVATAVTAGVLVSVGQFVGQIISFVVSILLTGSQLDLQRVDASTIGWLVLLVVVGAGALVSLIWVVPRLRRMIVPRVKQAVGDIRDVVSSPRKSLGVVGGGMASQLIYAFTLGLSLAAYGYRLDFPALVVVNTASALFAGLMPVPGGIGVSEASLAAGLIAYGVPPEVAGAAAITARLVTFYLPPIWGWGAFRWLSRHDYL